LIFPVFGIHFDDGNMLKKAKTSSIDVDYRKHQVAQSKIIDLSKA